ncbi:MAG: DUF2007 domain-containing protein [Stappiaceae bacterium]
MDELVKTNDIVLISFIEALLRDAGIDHIVLDQNMSILEGSLGIIPRRVLVDSDNLTQAKSLLVEAGIGHELEPDKKNK